MENGVPFGDDAHIIYVNAAYQDDTPLGKLMHDFRCVDPDEMNYQILRDDFLSVEMIAKYSDLPVEEVLKLAGGETD